MTHLKADKFFSKAKSHFKKGEIFEAIKFCQDILHTYPQNVRAKTFLETTLMPKLSLITYNNLVKLHNHGKYSEVIKVSEEYLSKDKFNALIWSIKGSANHELGKLEEALECFKIGIDIEHNNADCHNNMGTILEKKGQFQEAIIAYKKALNINPNKIETYFNLGNAYKGVGIFDKAVEYLRKAICLNPEYTEAYNNLGNVLLQQGLIDEAIEIFEKAILIKPDIAELHCNLGYSYVKKNEIEKAILAFNKSLDLNPNFIQSYLNLGNILSNKGKIIEAIEMYNKALLIKPDYEALRSQKLHQLANICDWKAIDKEYSFISHLGINQNFISPWSILSLEDNPANHRKRSEITAKNRYLQKPIPLTTPISNLKKHIHIGYFSSDFYDHATMRLLSKIFRKHDRERFKIYAYSYDVGKNDEIKEKFINSVDVFNDVSQMSDKNIALLARQDRIDIAVDLKGYTQNNRVGIFAYRASPIQVNFLGYPGTMGAEFIDYLIADKTIIPQEFKNFYSEEIIYMPHSYQPNDDSRLISKKEITRLEMGLPEDSFVFCCFNNSYKITKVEFDIWMRILQKVQGSVLWLLKTNKWAEFNLKKEAENRGVNSERIIFANKLSQSDHLARQKLADLFIDTFNVNAHTTASDALWGGLPVVTKLGKSFSARVAGSLLKSIGLSELITNNKEDYERLILELALDRDKLSKIKDKLVMNRLLEPLFDSEKYTRYLENGFLEAYENCIRGNDPKTIYINQ